MKRTELEATAGRTYRIVAGLGIAGTIGAGLWGGLPAAVGFALGAAFSGLNFHLWHRTVRKVGTASSPGTAGFGMRYVLFAMVGYAILNYFEANALAVLAGCFVAVAAVVLEILLELIFAGWKQHGT